MPATVEAIETAVREALSHVLDPEIRRPITELGMVRSVQVFDAATTEAGQVNPEAAPDRATGPAASGTKNGAAAPKPGAHVVVGIDLTVAACPLRDTVVADVTAATLAVDGVASAAVELGVMTPQQREEMRERLRGPDPVIPFAKADSLTKVISIASGKGGVGKSSVTANLAVALAAQGLDVGVVDADIYGFSIPRMLGATRPPTQVDNMILPPVAHGVKVISMGMFVPPGQPVVWRGPMLHRAIQQFLGDVYWGDLDVLLLDLPPGTGDVAISIAQLVPGSDVVVVTTPQIAAAEVAERAGSVAHQIHQNVIGVVENMSWLEQADGSRLEIFGSGGGQRVSTGLSAETGRNVPLLGQVPLDIALRSAADAGAPVVVTDPHSAAAVALTEIAQAIAARPRGLAGRPLNLSVNQPGR